MYRDPRQTLWLSRPPSRARGRPAETLAGRVSEDNDLVGIVTGCNVAVRVAAIVGDPEHHGRPGMSSCVENETLRMSRKGLARGGSAACRWSTVDRRLLGWSLARQYNSSDGDAETSRSRDALTQILSCSIGAPNPPWSGRLYRNLPGKGNY